MRIFATGLTAMMSVVASTALAEGEDAAYDPPEFIFACPDGGYQSGCAREDVEKAIALDGVTAADFAERCLYATRAACSVLASGRINRADNEPPLHWQMLALQPADGPYAEMIVLAQVEGPLPQLLLAHQVDGYLDPPVVARDSDGRFLLHVPARNRGLGNADLVLFTSGAGWNLMNADEIRQEIDHLLPSGFLTANPIVFNFREATAFALVRRDEDPGCCATGGTVIADFEQRDHELVVVGIGFQESVPTGRRIDAAP